jgi:hypothetical protein
MDAMIVSGTMPQKKNTQSFETFSKNKKTKNTLNVSKLSKNCRKQLQSLLLSKTIVL